MIALRGAPDEARRWFAASREDLIDHGAVLLVPHVDADEALMEVRLGSRGDKANARRRLDDARRRLELLGLDRLLPRIDRIASEL